MTNKRVRTILLVVLVFAVTGIRVVLAYKTAVCPGTDASVDDNLLMEYAKAMLRGEWVGPYGVYTLVKNPGYSMALATFRTLHLRYQLGFVLSLCFASFVASQSIRPLVPSRGLRALVYSVLLYHPAFFTNVFYTRVYRNGFTVIIALVLFSSFVGLYLRRREALRAMLPWSILAGISLGYFSIIQESALWAMPFAGACTAVTIVLLVVDALRDRRRGKVGDLEGDSSLPKHLSPESRDLPRGAGVQRVVRAGIIALPLVLYALVNWGLSSVNNRIYGVALTNDKYQGEFARATADIMRIDVGYDDARVWVSREALDQALKVSPTLALMRKEIDQSWEQWAQTSAGFNVLEPNDGVQVLGDHPYWALRGACDAYGAYTDAASSEHYWGTVADEIEAAFSSGRLPQKQGFYLSPTTQPMPWSQLPNWIGSTVKVMGEYAWGDLLTNCIIQPLPDTDIWSGALEAQLAARDLLGNNTLFTVDGKLFEDRTSEIAQPWLVASNTAGRIFLVVHRVLLCMAAAGAIILLVMDVRSREVDGARTALILLGLFLSCFVLVFGTTWMISFLTAGNAATDAAGPALSYSGSLYSLLALGMGIVLGRLAQMVLDFARSKKLTIGRERTDTSDERGI